VVGGLPTPLDAFEARRLVLTLLLLSAYANAEALPTESAPRRRQQDRGATRAAARRRHVRPARSC
jgi:hypothetical protein